MVGVLLLLLLMRLRYEQYQKRLSEAKIQQVLFEAEERQRNMINKTHVGLLLIDGQGRIEEINPMAKRYFSLSESMVRHLQAWSLFDTGNPNATVPLLLKISPCIKSWLTSPTWKRSRGAVMAVCFRCCSP